MLFVFKIDVPNENANFKYDVQRQNIVFCGTEILQGKASSGDHCKAFVIRTGNIKKSFKYVEVVLN